MTRETTRLSTPVLVALAILIGAVGASAGYMLSNEGAKGAVLGGGPADGAREKIVLAITPSDSSAAIQARATELEAFLENRTGYDFEIIIPLSYAGVVEALRHGHADIAFMGAWQARLAHDLGGARIALAENREVIIDGAMTVAPYYYSYYVVRDDSPYQTLEDLRGKSVAYSSLTSTSGYVYPVARLVELGLVPAASGKVEADPGAFFGKVTIAGGYGQAWEALKTGQADVAVIAGDVRASLFEEVMNGTRIVETQGPIPSHAVVFSKKFDGERADATKAALLELKGERKDLMRKLVSGIFVEFVETTTEQHTAPLGAALGRVGFRLQEKIG
ncbi:MAG TPA: phosphate/phosphite/phosphonate ABC transporter substrate-binding protein [Candidatus Thermoplasmatota archaeon]|nr:phosphate/phosphite/phosphonate ABC transporter substrate-binding protein [Candidatus Thermoplasmatota archaeon]